MFVIMVLPILTIVYGIFIGLGLVEINVSQFIINFLIFLVLTVLGGFINDAISYFVGMLTFFTEHMFGLNFLRNSIQSFLSGSLVPLSFMGAFGIICSYTPFAFLNSTPVLTLMCKFNNVDALIYVGVAFSWLIFLYQAIYRNSPEGMSSIINGFTFYEMVLYMITSFVFSFVVNSSETSLNIFQDIKEGTISNTLTKPVS